MILKIWPKKHLIGPKRGSRHSTETLKTVLGQSPLPAFQAIVKCVTCVVDKL
jgi:hypothetical protein